MRRLAAERGREQPRGLEVVGIGGERLARTRRPRPPSPPGARRRALPGTPGGRPPRPPNAARSASPSGRSASSIGAGAASRPGGGVLGRGLRRLLTARRRRPGTRGASPLPGAISRHVARPWPRSRYSPGGKPPTAPLPHSRRPVMNRRPCPPSRHLFSLALARRLPGRVPPRRGRGDAGQRRDRGARRRRRSWSRELWPSRPCRATIDGAGADRRWPPARRDVGAARWTGDDDHNGTTLKRKDERIARVYPVDVRPPRSPCSTSKASRCSASR